MTPGARAIPRSVWLAVLALVSVALPLALVVPLVDPDEGRNAEVSREMAGDGDVVVPHLGGMPYLDKPPALFWAGAVAVRVLGPRPIAARAPSLIAACATLLLLGWASSRLEPGGHAARVAALAACAPLFTVLSAYVIFDMPLTLCVTAVWTLLALELADGPRAGRRAAMFAAVAAGVLLKGPVMLAWAAGGSLAAALVLRERAPLRWLGWIPGWLIVLATAGSWFALALHRHPEYLHYAFVEESFQRMTTGAFRRDQPWWFVPAVLASGALPWSLATPWRWPRSRASRVALGFALFAAVFFTLSRSKLVTYLLPAIPALAWWAAECWEARAGARAGRLAFGLVVAFTPLALLFGGPSLVHEAERSSGAPLERAISATGGGTVRYEGCYSPGTDFLLGRRSVVVTETGHELTSNYVVRYRETLKRRGQWTPAAPGTAPPADVIVRDARRGERAPPAGYRRIHADRRFVAFRRESQ